MWQVIKRKNEERADVLKAMKALLTASETEKRELTADESKKFDELSAKEAAIQADIQRCQKMAELEGQAADHRNQPGREDINPPEVRQKEQEQEQRSAFDKFLRTGQVDSRVLTPAGSDVRALTTIGQGVVGPRGFYGSLIDVIKTYAGVRLAGAEILPTSDGSELPAQTSDDTANEAGIVGEGVSNSDAVDPSMPQPLILKAYKFDSKWIKVSPEMLNDAAYGIEAYVVGKAGERIGRGLNRYTTNGTGQGQPKGFLTSAQTGVTSGSQNAIAYDDLLDLVHSVDAGYRNTGKCRWQLHDSTLAAVRKLKDGEGRYIFLAGVAGAPSTLLEYGYVVNNHMPSLSSGAGSKVIAFGDFSRYLVRDVAGAQVVRSAEKFIDEGMIGFRMFSRHDGVLADTSAVKVLKLAA